MDSNGIRDIDEIRRLVCPHCPSPMSQTMIGIAYGIVFCLILLATDALFRRYFYKEKSEKDK
jgi:hypothetical protein